MFLGRVKHELFLWEGLLAHIWPRCFESLLLNVSCYHGNSILTWLEIKELTWALLFHNRMCLYLQPYQTSTSDFSFSHIFSNIFTLTSALCINRYYAIIIGLNWDTTVNVKPLSWWPFHLSSSQDVDVKVVDGLSTVLPVVDHWEFSVDVNKQSV